MIVNGIVVEETYYRQNVIIASETLDNGNLESVLFRVKDDFKWNPYPMI
jgi:hypothetical protein